MFKQGSNSDSFWGLTGIHPEPGEEIVWMGKPVLFLKFPGGLFDLLETRISWILYYGAMFLLGTYGLKNHLVWPFVSIVLSVFLVQILPFCLAVLKKNGTLYVVTNARIVFKSWHLFENKVHTLRFTDFYKTHLVTYSAGKPYGTIYLMTTKDPGFWTSHFATGERRDHPTFEAVADAEMVAKTIEAHRLKALIS